MNKFTIFKSGMVVHEGNVNPRSDDAVKAMFDKAREYCPCILIATAEDGSDIAYTIENKKAIRI